MKKPLRLCVAADKNGEGIVDPAAHLMCYQIRQSSGTRFVDPGPFFIADQFGDDMIQVTGPRELCVPSLLNPTGASPTPAAATPSPTPTATAMPTLTPEPPTPTPTPGVCGDGMVNAPGNEYLPRSCPLAGGRGTVAAVQILARIRVVLVRPRGAGNVGAVARAMKNMGLARLVLVDPPPLDLPQATAMAVHAADVLAARQAVATLAGAVGDCGLVVGTSGRAGVAPPGTVAPRALAPAIVKAAAANDVALVFGPEDHGLSNDELARCHHVLAIPANDAYVSLNLAQAVLLCAYELFLATAAAARGPTPAPRPLAASAHLELMYTKLETSLRKIGFLQPDSAVHVMRRLQRMLARAALDENEVQVLLGLARQIDWAAEHAGLS